MHAELFDPNDTAWPRPAWQVIEAARRRYLTGTLVLPTTPPTNVYLRDGQVYFAERTTDGGLAVRLLVEGVINREQMQKGTLQVSGVEHLGRLFERDDSIDRDAVELCVELMTDDVLTQVADVPVSGYDLQMYKRHPSGLDRWLPTRVEVVTHVLSSPTLAEEGATIQPGDGPRSRPRLPLPPPISQPVPVVVVDADPTPSSMPTTEMPAVDDTPNVDAILAGNIADEVAEAVRRALAAIDGPL